jgi:salicylate hydroxylase
MSQAALKLNILIFGGSIGGLAAAIPLARAGHNVTVFESRPELTQIGGAIAISPNGVRVLAAWGLEEKLKPFAQLDMGVSKRNAN